VNKSSLLERLRMADSLLLLFDFDGTLVEIAPSPDGIKPHPELLRLLERLSERPMTNVAVLSGRTLQQLETYIPSTLNVALAGSHGAQVRMPGDKDKVVSLFNSPDTIKELSLFAASIAPLSDLPGILIEEKGTSIAMHYRLAEPEIAGDACRRFISQAEQLKNFKDLEILEGKMVLEIRPKDVNKGSAVRFLCREFLPSEQALVACFGDDVTDIDAFRALPQGSIRIAIEKTIANLADYMLESPQELLEIIRRLLE
jgi:trehalose 6-phosphate phosphatase